MLGLCLARFLRHPPVPPPLSSLLHRTRTAVLALLLVVLPLQGVVQLVAGLQGQRHLHTGAGSSAGLLSSLAQPLRAVLDHLHAAQGGRHGLASLSGRGSAAEPHEHGGVFHRHSVDTDDVLVVDDAADDSPQAGVTAFLAWLPDGLAWLAPPSPGGAPAMAALEWRDRVVAPPLTPPRG